MFCPHCGNSVAPDARFCSACGSACAPTAAAPESPWTGAARIVRPRHPRMVAGVCSGFALHYGWDVNLTRVIFAVLSVFASGIPILVYIALWVILPDAPYALPSQIPFNSR